MAHRGMLGLFTLLCATSALAATTVVINGTASHTVPSTLYGQMFEDINHSGDGGLYAELLQNRAFQQVDLTNQSVALYPWAPIGDAELTVIADTKPVSAALPNSLQVVFPASSNNSVGFSNSGYWGINVDSSWAYSASFYYRFPSASSYAGSLIVGLRSSSGAILASEKIPVSGYTTEWLQARAVLKLAESAADLNNEFFVAIDAPTTEEIINFALLSLFPPTYKGRENGLRIDIAETLAEMGPAFFRFPGGNNLEGQSAGTRWQWNATVGSLLDRPGRLGDWGYINTDGLGLLEYLLFFEDVGMEPIMAVWTGYSLDGASLPEDDLAPYIQQAKDQINFVIGDPLATEQGALRAQLGHPEPFYLQYIEVGNEDFFASTTYPYRWRDFVGNLSAEFPQLKYIATTYPFDPILSPTPLQYDNHVYQTPEWFVENAFYYDSFERNGTYYFEGEYASISTNESNLYGTPEEGRFLYPTILSSTGEAAFMTGLERNSDIVFAASYAPLLQNVNSTQWTPDLVSFDAGQVIRSTSFYVQKLFSLNKGEIYLPSTLPTYNGTLYWTVTRSNTTGDVFIKVVNTNETAGDLVFELPFAAVSPTGTLQVLQGEAADSNTPEAPNYVTPKNSTITVGSSFNYTAPGYSVSVITVGTSS